MKPSDAALYKDTTITVAGIDYLLIPNSEDFFSQFSIYADQDKPVLAVVYPLPQKRQVDRSELERFRRDKLDKDDVFQSPYLKNFVILESKDGLKRVEDGAKKLLDEWTDNWLHLSHSSPENVPPGPYVYAEGRTWQPWRVYRDSSACFMKTFKPAGDGSGGLLALDSSVAGVDGRAIVPSRCYYKPSEKLPLHGARISVKDNIDVAGHKTTLCNRAWEDLYPEKEKNAACVDSLIRAGAVIVGKVKLQAMIMREEPLECVEFAAPFNPRGDGYQVPSGSSHASAASVAAYDWLDYSLGSDTNGSGRKPAHYNGCHSIRPSTGILNTDGVVGQFDKFDMPVFFGRDFTKFDEFISAWYGSSSMLVEPKPTKPVRILYPEDYLPTPNKDQTHVIETFVAGLEDALNVKRETISLAGLWKNDVPDGPDNADLAAYLELVGAYPYYRDAYWNLEDFRQEYSKKHGKPPFVHRAMHWQWDIAKTISVEERDKYWARSEKYRKWLLEKVFHQDAKESTIMVFPIEVGEPNYRDVAPPPFCMLSGYSSLNMSPIMQAPEVTVVAGQIQFESIVTKRTEPYPVGVSVIGVPGHDRVLIDVVTKGMVAAKIPTEVKTGRSVY